MKHSIFPVSLLYFIAAFSGIASESAVPKEWIALGVPAAAKNESFNIGEWKKYFGGFNERVTERKLLPADRDIFGHYISRATPIPLEGLKWFTMFLSDFSGSKYSKDLIEIARGLLDHPDEDIRALAAEALGGFKDKESVEKIVPLLGAKADENRASAKRALKQLGYELPYEEPSTLPPAGPSPTPGVK